MQRVIVMAGDSLGEAALEECWAWSASLATALDSEVLLATIDEDRLPLGEFVFLPGMVSHGELVRPLACEPAVMSAAPFKYREDGRPDWGAMWGEFCELALYGGPPHRGENSALRAEGCREHGSQEGGDWDAIAEIERGILETTGLQAFEREPGWLAVYCQSPRMAAWLCAAIILENVEARLEGDLLLLPAQPHFRLEDEVKSVITVLAKTHHYWLEHVRAGGGSVRPRASIAGWQEALARHNHAVPAVT